MKIKRVYLLAFIIFAHLFALPFKYKPHTFIRQDGVAYAFMDLSLAKDGDLYLENNLPLAIGDRPEKSFLSIGKNGKMMPKHPPALPFLAFPFFIIFGFNGLLIFNYLIFFLSIYFILKFFEESLSLNQSLALLSLFLLPYFYYYAYNFSPDILIGFFIVVSLWAILKEKEFLAGLFTGIMFFLRPNYIIQILPCTLISKNKRNYFFGLIFGFLPPLIYNTISFGKPYITGYHNVLVFTKEGLKVIDHIELFSFEPYRFLGIFFHYPKGIIFSAPISLVLLFALLLKIKENKKLGAFVFLTWIWHYIFYSFYVPWLADHSGIRFFLPVIMLSSLGALVFKKM